MDSFRPKLKLQDIRVGLMDLITGETNHLGYEIGSQQPTAVTNVQREMIAQNVASPTVYGHPRAQGDGSGDDGPWR